MINQRIYKVWFYEYVVINVLMSIIQILRQIYPPFVNTAVFMFIEKGNILKIEIQSRLNAINQSNCMFVSLTETEEFQNGGSAPSGMYNAIPYFSNIAYCAKFL